MNTLLEVSGLKKYFPVAGGFFGRPIATVRAVDGVSFSIRKGRVLGLVGESGCGKSTVGRVILSLIPKTDGQIVFDGTDLSACSKKDLAAVRRRMQMVFQDPFSSLDPRMNVFDIIAEGPRNFKMFETPDALSDHVFDLMRKCGLFPEQADRYAHQFSGGQRQRICIARALATDPDFIVLDEAVSALDVSIQAQIINLLKDLQEDGDLTYLFISHDLNIVRFISDDVAVMYLGEIVESGTAEEIFGDPKHPYTEALLSAVPAFTKEEKAAKKRIILNGELPSPYDMPEGCRFAERCPYAEERCRKEKPELAETGGSHLCRCHLRS
ncbi:MAG: ATP-binding cassette domain-containing protein [Lachnospiraceae bacterium]|nr:ATP-binding cassette domain-containing protein [Lachnospiraceae bacterium]